jgi:mRNA-degrading endonuclease RelE of RelBE toxin-antitoxin system
LGRSGNPARQQPKTSATTSKDLRLIYEVRDHELLVLVVAVGKRERNAVYRQADQR